MKSFQNTAKLFQTLIPLSPCKSHQLSHLFVSVFFSPPHKMFCFKFVLLFPSFWPRSLNSARSGEWKWDSRTKLLRFVQMKSCAKALPRVWCILNHCQLDMSSAHWHETKCLSSIDWKVGLTSQLPAGTHTRAPEIQYVCGHTKVPKHICFFFSLWHTGFCVFVRSHCNKAGEHLIWRVSDSDMCDGNLCYSLICSMVVILAIAQQWTK